MPAHRLKTNTTAKPVHPKAPFSFRKNLLPPLLGLMVFASILGLLNAQWLSAQYQYRFMAPVAQSNVAVSTDAPDPKALNITIPSINLTAPVVYDETSYDEGKVQLALRRGVVHYGTTALPGQAGNAVLIGHSSGQLWSPGEYKFVFTLLDKMKQGDRIFVDYKGTRYIYRVTSMVVVNPSDISVVQPTTQPQLTLITCTPVGTNKQRLIVRASQVSPTRNSRKVNCRTAAPNYSRFDSKRLAPTASGYSKGPPVQRTFC